MQVIRTSAIWCSRPLVEQSQRKLRPCTRAARDSLARRGVLADGSPQALAEKRCEPCESTTGSLDYMGLCMALSRQEAETFLSKSEVESWDMYEDDKARLHIRRQWKTKNFLKALDLCKRLGDIAEQEKHHPDLHITGWNQVSVDVWTHARDGLTENDFILAAKLNKVPKEDLLKKPKKKMMETY